MRLDVLPESYYQECAIVRKLLKEGKIDRAMAHDRIFRAITRAWALQGRTAQKRKEEILRQ